MYPKAHKNQNLDAAVSPSAFMKDPLHASARNAHSQIIALMNNPRTPSF